MSKLRQIVTDTIKEVVSQEPNPHIRDRKAHHVRRALDQEFDGSRNRERKR